MTAEVRELRDVLSDIVVELIVFCELSDEHEMHPDAAAKWLEFALAARDDLGASDRLWLFDRLRAWAASEPHPERRRVLEWLRDELLEESV